MTELAVIGYSGHAYVIIEAMEDIEIKPRYYVDIAISEKNPFGLEFLGEPNSANFEKWNPNISYFVAIGNNNIRAKAANQVSESGGRFIQVLHPSAQISKQARIGEGVFVAKSASINAFADVADFAIINTGAIVEHECKVGRYAHVAPGAIMLGSSEIGEYCFLGAGAILKPGIKVGEHSIIGAGAVVLEDIGENETWVGNPARKIK